MDVSRLSYVSKQGFDATIPVGLDPVLSYREDQTQTLTGIYVQDQLKWQNWRLTLGGRHDWLTSEYNTRRVRVRQ